MMGHRLASKAREKAGKNREGLQRIQVGMQRRQTGRTRTRDAVERKRREEQTRGMDERNGEEEHTPWRAVRREATDKGLHKCMAMPSLRHSDRAKGDEQHDNTST